MNAVFGMIKDRHSPLQLKDNDITGLATDGVNLDHATKSEVADLGPHCWPGPVFRLMSKRLA